MWFTVVHIRHTLNIPATPQKFRDIYIQKAWKKDTMATTLILAFDNNGNQN